MRTMQKVKCKMQWAWEYSGGNVCACSCHIVLTCENYVKKRCKLKSLPEKGMIYAWYIMGEEMQIWRSCPPRFSLLGIWPAKTLPIQAKSNGQARHEINWYDLSKTASSVLGLLGCSPWRRLNMVLQQGCQKKQKFCVILVQSGQQWILFSCNFRITDTANFIFLTNRPYFLKPFFPCFCEECRKLIVTLPCCWGMAFSCTGQYGNIC